MMDPLQNQSYYIQNPSSRYPQHIMEQQKYLSRQRQTNTLKELLQKPPQQCLGKTSLSPSGTFKYIKRQNAKAYYNNYGALLKPPIFTSQERVRRPLNCFMVFSHLERRRVAEEHPELHNADLSKILGRRWKRLSPLEKQPYIDEAERIRQLHTEIYPDYKYQPRRKSQIKRSCRKSDDDEDTTKEGENTGEKKLSENEEESVNSNKSDKPCITSQSTTEPFTNTCSPSASTISSDSNSTINVPFSNNFQQTNISSQPPSYQHATQQSSLSGFNSIGSSPNPYYRTNESGYTNQQGMQPPESSLRSFPPTPEVSPIMLNRNESVFGFDIQNYLNSSATGNVTSQQNQQQEVVQSLRMQQNHSVDLMTCQLQQHAQQQQQQQDVNGQICFPNYFSNINDCYYYNNNAATYPNHYSSQQSIMGGNAISQMFDSISNH